MADWAGEERAGKEYSGTGASLPWNPEEVDRAAKSSSEESAMMELAVWLETATLESPQGHWAEESSSPEIAKSESNLWGGGSRSRFGTSRVE